MLKQLQRFLTWFASLFKNAENTDVPTPEVWEQLRKRTCDYAGAMGSKELPESSASDLSNPERNIETLALREKRFIERVMDSEKSATIAKLADFAPGILEADLKCASEKSETNFYASMKKHSLQVFIKRKEFIERNKELKVFKIKNKLTNPSNHPKSVLLHWGILLTLILIELITNSIFMAEANKYLFLGAFVQVALPIALGGMLAAYIISFFIRWSFHRSLLIKFSAYFGSLVSVMILFVYIMLVGHFRDIQHYNPEVLLEAIDPSVLGDTILERPFVFKSIESYLMVFVILLFSGVAVIDFLKMDDLYPGYGKRTKKRNEAFDEYKEETELQRALLKESYDSAINEIKAFSGTLQTKFAQQTNTLGIYHLKEQKYILDIESLNNKANNILSEFRQINKNVRKTPPPIYFNTHKIQIENSIDTIIQPILTPKELDELQSGFSRTLQEITFRISAKFREADETLSKDISDDE